MSTVTKADRQAWASARTLADLGELTAQWVEGRIGSQPGYYGRSDIEDPAMIPVLAGLNRAGFVTTCSQAGHAGAAWEQCAAVEGFAGFPVAMVLQHAAREADLDVVAHSPVRLPRWRYSYREAVIVTRRNGRPYTDFGCRLPRRHIRDSHLGYGACHRDAVAALEAAWQVTVIDPEWGRNDLLWDVLDAALAGNGVAS